MRRNGPRAALHLNAKFHLARELRKATTIKPREECTSDECDQVRLREWAVAWDAVEVELRVGARRPDLTLIRGGVAVAAVEVFATHAVDDEKARALADAQLPWVVQAVDPTVGHELLRHDSVTTTMRQAKLRREHLEAELAKVPRLFACGSACVPADKAGAPR